MLNRFVITGVCVCTAMLTWAQPAGAQQQTVNFTLGYFTPLGEDARTSGDVLNANLNAGRYGLFYEIDDFNGPSVGGEWLFPFGEFIEGGIGVSFSTRTVPSVYQNFIDADGTEIDQDLRLRIVPTTFTVRLIPTGQGSVFQPYIGVGLGIFSWKYSETGEFIDPGAGDEIFRDSTSYVQTGANVGPVVVGGLRFAGRTVSSGFEIRYQKAEGELNNLFAGPKIDLGGWTYNWTIGVRF
jgi:hypothetical protein